MKIPRKFMLGGEFWKVRYKKNLTYNKKVMDGLCEGKTRTIWIRAELNKAERWSTFVHEFLHACFIVEKMGAWSEHLTYDQEETVIQGLEKRLIKHFRLTWRWR